jgi:ribonuclease G
MSEEILINVTPQETRVAITGAGAVQELLVERAASRGLVGDVYMGKVARVLPGMQSAFVDIGLERAAFLHVADIQRKNGGDAQRPIEKILSEGEPILVQVVKDPIGTKGARLSTQISIAGRLLVFLPQDSHIGISQKIGSPELREQLRTRMATLVGAGRDGEAGTEGEGKGDGKGGGFILRTNAAEASDAELADDIDYLRKTWARVRERAFKSPPGTLLYQDLSLAERVLRDLADDRTQTIRIDSRVQFEALSKFGREYTPGAVGRLQHYAGERPIFDLFSVDEEIAKALLRRVDLKSGGYLIIDQTEALTTVDVNTGGFVGARNFDDTIFKTNLEAGQAIARQLRLRNLGGIIIIDFIDMSREEHRSAVLAELKKQLARDRTKITVSGFTQLGLVEMTRKRTRESLAHMLCEPCPICHGRGEVKTARSVCHDILREILREARQFNPKEFRVVASAEVIEMLLDEENQHLAGLSDFIGKPISLQAEPFANPEQYDIVLL